MFMLRSQILPKQRSNTHTKIFVSSPLIYDHLYLKITAVELKPNFVWFNPILRDTNFQVSSGLLCQLPPAGCPCRCHEAYHSLNSLQRSLLPGYYKKQLFCVLRTEFLSAGPQPNSLVNCSLLSCVRESLRLLIILLSPDFKIFIKQGGIQKALIKLTISLHLL